jgi:hypothetical protein
MRVVFLTSGNGFISVVDVNLRYCGYPVSIKQTTVLVVLESHYSWIVLRRDVTELSMERANDVRALMKQGAKLDSGASALSGKDKAKLLKMMREQQKQKDTAPPVRMPAQNTASATPSTIKPSSHTSGLPEGFFDSASPAAASTAPVTQPVPPKPTPSSSVASSLPQGFFDNPVEDLSARGISMEQYTAKMEQEEKAELNAFLTEVKGTVLFVVDHEILVV